MSTCQGHQVYRHRARTWPQVSAPGPCSALSPPSWPWGSREEEIPAAVSHFCLSRFPTGLGGSHNTMFPAYACRLPSPQGQNRGLCTLGRLWAVSEHPHFPASQATECAVMELKGHHHPGPLTAGAGVCVPPSRGPPCELAWLTPCSVFSQQQMKLMAQNLKEDSREGNKEEEA